MVNFIALMFAVFLFLISDLGYANEFIAQQLNRITHKHVSYVGNPKLMNNVMGDIKILFPSLKLFFKITLEMEELKKLKIYALLQQENLMQIKCKKKEDIVFIHVLKNIFG